MEENPLAAPPAPGLVLAEAPEPVAAAEVEAKSPGRSGRGAGFGQGLAFDWRFISLGGAGLVGAPSCRGQQGQLWGGAFPVEQRGELPLSQV